MTNEDRNLEIAYFMGAIKVGEYNGAKGGYSDTILLQAPRGKSPPWPANEVYLSHTNLKYHSDWNWLKLFIDKLWEAAGVARASLLDLRIVNNIEEVYLKAYHILETKVY